jgi:uncharacterized membrane protein YhdT
LFRKDGIKRVDELGKAYAGSQLQIQIYVNRRSKELSQKIIEELPSLASLCPRLDWVSPLEKDKFTEYQDTAFLKACDFEHLSAALMVFWPRGGPVWDALASIDFQENKNHRGILLVEAKSHPTEIYGTGCRASSESRKKIERALNSTKRCLGVSKDTDWTGPLYQSANRIAHLYFLSEIVNVPAWLVNVYFLNDSHSPTDFERWQELLGIVKTELGIFGLEIPHIADIFLEAKDRSEAPRASARGICGKAKRNYAEATRLHPAGFRLRYNFGGSPCFRTGHPGEGE